MQDVRGGTAANLAVGASAACCRVGARVSTSAWFPLRLTMGLHCHVPIIWLPLLRFDGRICMERWKVWGKAKRVTFSHSSSCSLSLSVQYIRVKHSICFFLSRSPHLHSLFHPLLLLSCSIFSLTPYFCLPRISFNIHSTILFFLFFPSLTFNLILFTSQTDSSFDKVVTLDKKQHKY